MESNGKCDPRRCSGRQISWLTFMRRTATFPTPTPGKDLVLLDTGDMEGAKEWSGSFVGTSFIFSHRANLETLEGDPRFFFDDSLTPQAQGTGTEEWGGGGDYWGGLNMTLPFVGHPVGARSAQFAVSEEDKIESAYRFLLADLMPFGKNAVIHLEHGGKNESTEHYETVAYWYGLPTPSVVETDRLQIGDAAAEHAHDYSSPQASAPYTFSSRYEWGVDIWMVRSSIPRSRTQAARPRAPRCFAFVFALTIWECCFAASWITPFPISGLKCT